MSKREIDAATRDVLARASVEGRVLKLPGQLARADYERVDKVLKGLGGKWDRKAGGHVFPFDPSELLGDAVEEGTYSNRQQDLQLFETPPGLAARMCQLAGLGGPFKLGGLGKVVLEPSAGRGRIVNAIHETQAIVTAVEIDETNVRSLSCMRTPPSSSLIVHRADFLLWAARHADERFDAVVMNPPFSRNQDVDHIMAAWPLVKPGGRLVSICSLHAFMASERKCEHFCHWLEDVEASVDDLPAGTFKESGTMVATKLVEILRPRAAAAAPPPRVDDLPLFGRAA